MLIPLYCESISQLIRWETTGVKVGEIVLGGNNPIRIQTMTTTNTNDTNATIGQSIRAIDAGAELIRVTAQGIREAKNVEQIKSGLVKHGYKTPLVVDIHFNPDAAIEAAYHADKVRINPGNYADHRAAFVNLTFSDEEYAKEIIKVENQLLPLLEICRKRSVSLRIGVNHGSLSDRIMSRYGDTPEGMVESALEFLNICREHAFHNLVISMKASNTRIMVYATRLLVSRMRASGMNYPLHLGVTEAGDGEDGRIKSAVGIGTLLADGLGDTIRVSLTEEPEAEIPVAKKLVSHFVNRETNPKIPEITTLPYNPYEFTRRKTLDISGIGGNNPPVVIADLSQYREITYSILENWGWRFDQQSLIWKQDEQSADFIILGDLNLSNINKSESLPIIFPTEDIPFITKKTSPKPLFIKVRYQDINEGLIKKITNLSNCILLLETLNTNGFAEQRAAFITLMQNHVLCPVVICRNYSESDTESFQLKSASDVGGLLIDGLGDGVMISAPEIDARTICSTVFSILQASRVRISKTEYISCPGCGRTLFNLQEAVSKIRTQTNHLKGLKIGVMGCIVNGPGEMADADYGYVGAGPKKINLYKGKVVVKKNIPEDKAVEELIRLIKEHGDWNEPV